MDDSLFGGIEAGGTKFICAVGDASGNIVARTEIPTTSVEDTLRSAIEFFKTSPPISGLGIGTFGPVELNPHAEHYGYITNAPKPGWQNVDILGTFKEALRVPMQIDTDVNCAALGEQLYGAAQGNQSFIYITVGTGIGGAVVVYGEPYRGVSHLEMGHIRIPHEPLVGDFQGACTFHGDCLEGLASGYALEERYGMPAKQVTATDAWNLEAGYLSSALSDLTYSFAPQKIILGGGVMQHPGLLEAIKSSLVTLNNHYIELPPIDDYVVASSNPNNGVLGALRMVAR